MNGSDLFYFLAVVGGPVLLMAALAFAVIRTVRTRMRRPAELQEPRAAAEADRGGPGRHVHG